MKPQSHATISIQVSATDVRPLDAVTISAPGAQRLCVRDGAGRCYLSSDGARADLLVGGSLGSHLITAEDAEGRVVATASLRVETTTAIRDGSQKAQHLLERLADTMFNDWHSGYRKGLRIDGKFYRYYVSWIRDHVHSLKGMKYFDGDRSGVQSGIELYADSQRDDGMIWDKCKAMLHSDKQNWRDHEFKAGDFIRKIPGHPTRRWQRIPVENDVEYLFVEGLHATWKATGDTPWMARHLDHALRAIAYGTSDRYRWSSQYQLLKRGYTIDTWDFQHAEDVAISGSSMKVDPDRTRFNIFFGDNTGMIMACRCASDMLHAAGRDGEAEEFSQRADAMQKRLDELAWNGRFYTHMISEDPSVRRDVGSTIEAEQVSQSNAYSLNRGIDHDKAVAIIDRYQGIRQEMPASSAGEFYSIFPPFAKGFGHNDWNYMNGGVTSICGGELAHGAFQHGREAYGADVLQRLLDWSDRLGGYLHCCLRGAMPGAVACTYAPISLNGLGNMALDARASDGLPTWGEGDNDFRHLPVGEQTMVGIPLQIGDGTRCGGKAGIQIENGSSVQVPVGRRAKSLYIVHTSSGGKGSLVGWFTAQYQDGTHATQYVQRGSEIDSWFMPAPDDPNAGGNQAKRPTNLRSAWQGPNGVFENVGVQLYAWANPHADREISQVTFTAAETAARWLIVGLTASDGGIQLPISPVSYGIPDMWGAAAVVYALIEGQAGVVDTGVAFDRCELSPRWAACDEDRATVDVVYPSSGGYASYRYTRGKDQVRVLCTGSAHETRLRILLADGCEAVAVTCNGSQVPLTVERVEASRYVVVDCPGVGVFDVVVTTGA
jgi:hypothetical protein